MVSLVGQSFGRYHLVERIGEGGMASVYKAFDKRLSRNVAVKVINASLQDSSNFLLRFEREAKALAHLSHPNIVKIYDFGEERGNVYLVMEYIPGGTLKNRLGTPMPVYEAAHFLTPIAHALAYAHRLNIIHRDVKPANILISDTGEPLLSDFGIAKVVRADPTVELTGTGVGIGTPEYVAPEQGMGTGVDHRSDIYSLGIVFYELITGHKPFQAETPMAVVLKQINEPPPNPRRDLPNLPIDAERIVLKSMAKKPGDRFQDMQVFAEALEKLYLATRPTNADEKIGSPPALTPRPSQSSVPPTPLQPGSAESNPAYPQARPSPFSSLTQADKNAVQSDSEQEQETSMSPLSQEEILKRAASLRRPAVHPASEGQPEVSSPSAHQSLNAPDPSSSDQESVTRMDEGGNIPQSSSHKVYPYQPAHPVTPPGPPPSSSGIPAQAWQIPPMDGKSDNRSTYTPWIVAGGVLISIVCISILIASGVFLKNNSSTLLGQATLQPSRIPTTTGLDFSTADEAVAAFNQGTVDKLDDLIVNEYPASDYLQTGKTLYFSAIINGDKALLWVNSWCTRTQDILPSNSSQIDFKYLIDGIELSDDHIGSITETLPNGNACVRYLILLKNWSAGEYNLEQEMVTAQTINDGWDDYPAGSYMRDYSIIVKASDQLQEELMSCYARIDRTSLMALSETTPLYCRTFDDANDAMTGMEVGDYGDLTSDIFNGKYTWRVHSISGVVYFRPIQYKNDSLDRFGFTIEATRTGGATNTEYGIIFRYNSNTSDGYNFTIQDVVQTYSASLFLNGEWITLQEPTTFRSINPGGMNRLAVIADGTNYDLIINGETAYAFQDTRLSQGGVGVTTTVFSEGESADFEFDNFLLVRP